MGFTCPGKGSGIGEERRGEGGTDDAVELAPFVALRSPLRVLRFTRAELPEVFGRFGRCVGEELHFDAAEGFACRGGLVRRRGFNYDVAQFGMRIERE